MKNYIISEELANKIITYLSEKPFKESASLIGELMQLKEVNIIPSIEEKKGGDDNGIQSDETKREKSDANVQENGGTESNG